MFTHASLPNGGQTAHFSISYDDTLSKANGLDRATDLVNACEGDLALIQSWFPGVNFQFAFPISVQVTGQSGGAQWTDPPDFALWFGFHPSVDLMPGSMPTTTLLRYLLVSEVTEMFMASQRKQWFGDTHVSGADEGSMGEALSRFLASEFLTATGLSKTIPSGFRIANLWLNDSLRPNFIDIAPDDNQPDFIVGCAVNFLFFLKYQLGNSIQQIVAASASSLGGVFTNLTGKTNGFQTFKDLVDMHYPTTLNPGVPGPIVTRYFPPLDNVFPVADLSTFAAPTELSWATNAEPNIAWVFLDGILPVTVRVNFTSDDKSVLDLPASQAVSSHANVILTVPQQPAGFTSKVVNLTASYAGKTLSTAVTVVRPEALPVAPLQILATADDPCVQHLVENSSQDFIVTNSNVIMDQTGLTYRWTVTGANAPVTNSRTLTIPSLPAAGTSVTVKVTLRNAAGIEAHGTFSFKTVGARSGLREEIRYLNCTLQRFRAINAEVLSAAPRDGRETIVERAQLANIETEAARVVLAAERVVSSLKATRVQETEVEAEALV